MSGTPLSSLTDVSVRIPRHAFATATTNVVRSAGVLWFAGSLTNGDDLRIALSRQDLATDAELVSAAFLRWGVDAFSRLRGPFAVAVREPGTEQIVLARDHAGVQPLFYRVTHDTVSLASSIRDLARVTGPLRPDPLTLADALCRRFPDPTETFFMGVRRVLPGHYVRISTDRIDTTRYFAPLFAKRSRDDAQDWAGEFARLQQQAVARCYVADRTGVLLSGGLDSGSVAMVAAAVAGEQNSTPPFALAMFLPAPCDESRIQQGLASALGLPMLTRRFDGFDPVRTTSESLALNQHLSSPLMGFWTPAYNALTHGGRQRGMTHLLTGIGGDEWLSASAWEAADLMRRGRFLAAWRFGREWARTEDGNIVRDCGVRPLVSMCLDRVAAGAWSRARTRRLTQGDPAWIGASKAIKTAQAERAHGALRPSTPVVSFAAADTDQSLMHALSSQFMEEDHDLAAQTGVVRRHPYYDPDLIAFLCRVPLRVLNQGGTLKGLVRQQLQKRFPALGYSAQRKVLASDLFASSVGQQLASAPASSRRFETLAGLGVIEPRGANAFVDANLANPAAVGRIWNLMNLEAWAAAHAS